MALKLHFSALAMGASVDQQTGTLSVFEIIDEIRSPELPIQIPNMVLALSLEKTNTGPSKGKVFIHLLTPDGKQNLLGQGDLGVPAEQKRLKAVFRFGGLPLQQFGNYRFVISWLNAENVKEGEALCDFEVIKVAAPPKNETPVQTH
jgi:hypothetical protein